MERFHVSLEWHEAMDQQLAAKRKRKLSSMCNDANLKTLCCICIVGACAQRGIYGYDENQPPYLEGEGYCIHFLFPPCIVSSPPSFVTGQSGPHPRNNQHRYRLYRLFWKSHDCREILCTCPGNVRSHMRMTLERLFLSVW